jgi:hypothetical protein
LTILFRALLALRDSLRGYFRAKYGIILSFMILSMPLRMSELISCFYAKDATFLRIY